MTLDPVTQSVLARKLLLIGLGLCFALYLVGSIGFLSAAYAVPSTYPRWSYVVLRLAFFLGLLELLGALAATIFLPRRWRSFGVLVLAYFVFAGALFLTHGEP